MSRPVKRALFLVFGWGFVVLGILGIFLPILQGILFLLVGFVLLSRESFWVRERVERLKLKYPKFGEKYDEAEAYAARFWQRLVTMNGKRPNNGRAGEKPEDV